MENAQQLLSKIQAVLSRDLLYPRWKKIVTDKHHLHTGLCYPAAEALFHICGKEQGYLPCYTTADQNPAIPGIGFSSHWFLRHPDGRVLDPTAAQFPKPVPYHLGTCCGFLTKRPSKRAKEIIRRVNRGN